MSQHSYPGPAALRARPWARLGLPVALCALLTLACDNTTTRTQLTFQLAASPDLQMRLATLKVTVRSAELGDRSETFAKRDLTEWPVEIVVLPAAGNRSTDKVTLFVTVRDAADAVLAQPPETSANFVPEKWTIVPVALDADAVLPGDEDAGQDEPDAGEDKSDGGQVEPPPPPPDGGPAPRETCATKGTKIRCDDGNPCNGTEGCEPLSTNADANGCVPSRDPIVCSDDMTCDRETGKCSTCLKKSDGDGDKADSMACGGRDCDDSDDTVAPGKPELCDGKDNDCDGTRDGPKADAACASSAPKGGTASCVAGVCAPACPAGKQAVNKECVPIPASCPMANPCLPGSCMGGVPTYSCTCPPQYRAGVGMTRCAKVGVPMRTIGFETACGEQEVPGDFVLERKAIAANLYASCGVTSLTSGSLMTAVQLIKPLPMMTTIAGLTGETALVVSQAANMGGAPSNSELVISFSPAVNELSFDLLDIDNVQAPTVTLKSGTTTVPGTVDPPAAGTRSTRFKYASAEAVDSVTITYTPMAANDALYIDALSYRVSGCGDGVQEGSEACDDGNGVQCDGCDNACGLSASGCLNGATCLAAGALSTDMCLTCSATAMDPAGGELAPVPNPGAPASCAP